MHIQQNESTLERFIRIALGGILIIVATYLPMSILAASTAIIIGGILLLTALAGYCPINKLLGLNTCK